MKYKVGDKVKVRSDLVKDNWYGHYVYVSAMDNFKGEQTIREIRDDGYLIYGDCGNYRWTDEMFEDTEENKMDNNNITVNMENLSQEERSTLLSLIEKANKPKNKAWKPEKDEKYYYSYSYGSIEQDTYHDNNVDTYVHKNRYAIGNCFKTREEAEFAIERQKVITELKRYAMEHNEEKIDWNNGKQIKYSLSYQHNKNMILIDCCYSSQCCSIFFTSEEIAIAAIKEIGEERLKKYYFEEKATYITSKVR